MIGNCSHSAVNVLVYEGLSISSFSSVNLFLSHFRKLAHVRAVSQGDVHRASPKDIPKIFQVSTLHIISKHNDILRKWQGCKFAKSGNQADNLNLVGYS